MESYRAWVLCFDASGDHTWAAAASPRGAIQFRKARLISGGRERSGALVLLVAAVLAKQGRPPSLVATFAGPSTPGGIRHNVVLANALAWAWGVPVVGLRVAGSGNVVFRKHQRAGTLRPVYIHPPHITRKR